MMQFLAKRFGACQPFHLSSRKRCFWWPARPFDDAEYRRRQASLLSLLETSDLAMKHPPPVVIIPSAPTLYRSQNIFWPFHQNPNLTYFTGLSAPNCIATLYRQPDGEGVKCVVFAKQDTSEALLWSGPGLTPQRATEQFGADESHDICHFADFVRSFCQNRTVIYDCGLNDETDAFVQKAFQDVAVEQDTVALAPFAQRLRVCKSALEVDEMRRIAKTSAESFRHLFTGPLSKGELQTEAAVECAFALECAKRGAAGLAYVPVVAGGTRGLHLHYTHNSQPLFHGSTCTSLLMDAGAISRSGYCSDISRTVHFASAKDSPKKTAFADLYTAVLSVQKECIMALNSAIHNGYTISLNDLHLLSERLFAVHLPRRLQAREDSMLGRLYPHSIGHYLGLDLHDCPTVSCGEPLKPGTVITIEPGIYIPLDYPHAGDYAGIAIRIEDDVVVGEDGVEVLTKDAPKSLESILFGMPST